MLALSALAGALVPTPMPRGLAVVLAAGAYLARRPVLFAAAIALLCSALASAAWRGIDAPRDAQADGTAIVVTDPVQTQRSVNAVIRLDGDRYLASAWGPAAATLRRADAGDRVEVAGKVAPYHGSRERSAALHTGHRLSIGRIEVGQPANPLFALANGLRDRISGGAGSLPDERLALFTGLVYGDNRGQSPLTETDFRVAGLTHLLAVSGQNVAYLLTLAGPLVRRLPLRARWMFVIALLVVFATITRYEPSVLRATWMAALAVTARWLGREASSGRLLALAVTALLVIDPLLATTIAFRLSVAASAGLVWLRPLVARHLRGPAWFVDPLAVTIAAQVAVAPILIGTFGPVSLVSIPANMLAAPLAGFTMGWGMTVGLGAGFLPAAAAAVVHQPTTVMLAALEAIARTAARLPLAPVDMRWLAMGFALALWRRRQRVTRWSALGQLVMIVTLLMALIPSPAHGRHEIGPNSELVHVQGVRVLVLRDTTATGWVLDDLHSLQVRRLDAVIAATDAQTAAVATIGQRIRVDRIVRTNDGTFDMHIRGARLVVDHRDGKATVTFSG